LADRLASAWLIRAFHRSGGDLVVDGKDPQCLPTAVGFGFEGATFFNSKDKVTFQELLAKFSLDNNETLTRIGALVHYLDTGGSPVAGSGRGGNSDRGRAPVAATATRSCSPKARKTFDLLYEAYFDVPGQRPRSPLLILKRVFHCPLAVFFSSALQRAQIPASGVDGRKLVEIASRFSERAGAARSLRARTLQT